MKTMVGVKVRFEKDENLRERKKFRFRLFGAASCFE